MTRLERVDARLGEQPREWPLIWFEAAEADADRLARALSNALAVEGGWYADFHSATEVTVAFAPAGQHD